MATTNHSMFNLLHIFGLSRGVKNNLHFVDDNILVYPCGHATVFYTFDIREQTIIPALEESAGITAMALTATRRYLAVAERVSQPPSGGDTTNQSQAGSMRGGTSNLGPQGMAGGVINIYDCVNFKRRRVLVFPDLGSDEYVCVAFSHDGRFCLSQGGAPEWQTVLWAAEKAAKIICTMKPNGGSGAEVVQADFCPNDPTVVCLSGRGILKFFRVAENQFRPIPLNLKGQEPLHYLCHAWVNDERLLACTEAGEIMVIDNYELKTVLTQNPDVEQRSINAIATFSKGFVCGGEAGSMRIYERTDDPREPYKVVKSLVIESNAYAITTITISPSEDTLACSTENNQMYTLTLSNTDILKDNADGAFEPLTTPLHGPGPSGSAQITGIDTCVWKPLVATCGLDKSVRLWNFLEKTVEVMKYFSEEAYSIALHPSGLYVVVGFSEKLRYMSILMDDIRLVKEIAVKGCRVVEFSQGGQMFAAVNGSSIMIYNSYTFEVVSTLRAHNGKVRAILWHNSDLKLLSCGMDGAIFLWDVISGQRVHEYPQGRYNFHDATATPDLSRTFMIGSEGPIKDFDVSSNQFKENIPTNVWHSISRLALLPSQRALFATSQTVGQPGVVYGYRMVPTFQPTPEYYITHGGPVTCCALSHDGLLLFTGAEDGSLAMFIIHDIHQTGGIRLRELDSSSIEFTEEILVTRSDLDEKEKNVAALRSKVDELNLNNEYQMRLKDMNYMEKTKEVTSKFQADVEMDKRRFDELQEEKRNMELEYEERIQELEGKHKKEHRELETTYTNKTNAEVARFQQLKSEEEEQNRFWDEENQTVLEKNEQYLKNMEEEYQRKVEEEQSLQKKLAEEKKSMEREFTKLKSLIEEDADMEIDEVKQKYNTNLQSERDKTLRLKGENSIMKKKYLGLQKDVATNLEEIKGLQDQEQGSHEVIHGLEKDIQGHKKEIREREETIADKEKRIYDLKKKNQELEKFKFVLDYKIKELKRQIEPRENEIADMRNQIEEMDLELEQYHKSNSALDLMIGELRLKMDGMQKEIGSQERVIQENSAYIDRYRRDLHQALQNFTNHNKLKKDVVALYKQYVQEDVLATASFLEGDAQREYNRQREHLERNVAALKRNIAKDFVMHEKDTARLRRENITLTKEINSLRREAKMTNLQMKNLERDLETANIPHFSRTGRSSRGGRSSRAGFKSKSLRSQSAGNQNGTGGGVRPSPPSTSRKQQPLSMTMPGSIGGRPPVDERKKEIEMQRQQIRQLEEQYKRLQEALAFTPRNA